MIRRCILMTIVLGGQVFGQPDSSAKLKGLRVYGEGGGLVPLAQIDSKPVTIEFDTEGSQPPDLRLKFFHCDKDWRITNNSFINDELRTTTRFQIPYTPAPKFVRHYSFHYKVDVPGFSGFDRFSQSGNYIFQIWDKEEKELYASGRFFVVEQLVHPAIKIRNRLLPSSVNPWNQVNKVEVSFTIPESVQTGETGLYPILMKTIDIYKNRQLHSPFRVSADDENPNTFVDGFGLRTVKFVIENIPPGNEYRRLDLRNVDKFPRDYAGRVREGADVSRFLQQGKKDHNGESAVTTEDEYSDYLDFSFELLREDNDLDSVYVVGDFNDWTPSEPWRMAYDAATKRYALKSRIRRGAYDYQYVVGMNDWITLEGNDFRTVNLYSAFIYYHDPRFGGFDRIVGFVQGLSAGGREATAN